MAIRPILRMGEPLLLLQAQAVLAFGRPKLLSLVQDLQDTMAAASGAGLAAPQIGENWQVVVFGADHPNPRYPDSPVVPKTVLINPQLEALSDDMEEDWEGCLSLPGLRGRVPRHRHIRYRGHDEHGQTIERVATGFHARVVQHECDHLRGILYPLRMHDLRQFGFSDILLANTPS